MRFSYLIILCLPALLSLPASAGQPPVDSSAAEHQQLMQSTSHLHAQIQAIAASSLTAEEKRERLARIMRENPQAFTAGGLNLQGHKAFNAALLKAEALFFKAAVAVAPTEADKQAVVAKGASVMSEEEVPDSAEAVFQREAEPVVIAPPARTVEPVEDDKLPLPVVPAEKPGAPNTQQLASAGNSGTPQKPHHPRESMTAQAGDPTAPLVQAQMTYFYSDVLRNSSDSAAQFTIQPEIPLPPNKLVPMGQLIRPTVPFQDAPDGKSGLADISVEHVFLPEPEPWGALGYG